MPLASSNQPGSVFTTSANDRPGSVVIRCCKVSLPTRLMCVEQRVVGANGDLGLNGCWRERDPDLARQRGVHFHAFVVRREPRLIDGDSITTKWQSLGD